MTKFQLLALFLFAVNFLVGVEVTRSILFIRRAFFLNADFRKRRIRNLLIFFVVWVVMTAVIAAVSAYFMHREEAVGVWIALNS
jgi:hypothetical protein